MKLEALDDMGKASSAKKTKRDLAELLATAMTGVASKSSRSQRLKRVVTVIVTGIGLISAYVTIFGYFWPRITVQSLAVSDPKDASSAVFVVTNQSPLDLQNVAIGCRFVNFYLQDTKWGVIATRRTGNEQQLAEIGAIYELIPRSGFYDRIQPQHSGTLKLPFSLPPAATENLDIEIVVHYRPSYYTFKREEVFRFVAKTGADGYVHWLPHPDLAVNPYTPQSFRDE